MKKITFPFNDTKTLSMTAGGTVSWPLARLQQKLKSGRPLGVRGFRLEFSGTLEQAATTGPAFQWVDFVKFITQLRISRVGGGPRVKITGHSVRVWNALTNCGYDRGFEASDSNGLPLADLAANSGGSVADTVFTIRVDFRYDTPGLAHKNYFVKAASLFEKGYLEFDYTTPTTAWSSSVSLITSLTCNLYAELGASKHLTDGVDIELFNLDNTTTSSGSTMPISRGSYPFIVLACEKFGGKSGGDLHTRFSEVSAVNFFPEELPALSGQQLRDRYLADQAMQSADIRISSSVNMTKGTMVEEGSCLPLVYPEAFGDIQSCALRAEQDWSLKTTLSASLTTGHRLLLARALPRPDSDIKDLACTHGIDLSRGGIQAEVPDPSDPTTPSGVNYWPIRLLDQMPATTNIRTGGSKRGGGGCAPKRGACGC